MVLTRPSKNEIRKSYSNVGPSCKRRMATGTSRSLTTLRKWCTTHCCFLVVQKLGFYSYTYF